MSQSAVSRLLKKHREICSVKVREQSTMILEYKGPILEEKRRCGMWPMLLRPIMQYELEIVGYSEPFHYFFH